VLLELGLVGGRARECVANADDCGRNWLLLLLALCCWRRAAAASACSWATRRPALTLRARIWGRKCCKLSERQSGKGLPRRHVFSAVHQVCRDVAHLPSGAHAGCVPDGGVANIWLLPDPLEIRKLWHCRRGQQIGLGSHSALLCCAPILHEAPVAALGEVGIVIEVRKLT
jgi:hypothetical protein